MVLKTFSTRSYIHTAWRYGENTEKLREKKLLHTFFKVIGRIRITIEEMGPLKVVIHMSDLGQYGFPEFDDVMFTKTRNEARTDKIKIKWIR